MTTSKTATPEKLDSASADTESQLPPADDLLYWCEEAQRRLRTMVTDSAGGDHVLVPASQGRVLQLIPDEGARMSDLAERALVTKQAMGQVIDQLESRDMVRSVKLPHDARVRFVQRTALGDRACRDLRSLVADVEARLASELGADRLAGLKATLRHISDAGH